MNEEAMRAALRGCRCPQTEARRLRADVPAETNPPPALIGRRPVITFTEHQMLVLCGIAAGGGNEKIARQLGCTVNTVKTTLVRVYRKLGAVDRAHAVHLAYQCGLLRVAPPAVIDVPLPPFDGDRAGRPPAVAP